MRKSALAIVALIFNITGVLTMLYGLLMQAECGFEKIVFWGGAGILGIAQLAGALLISLGIKSISPPIQKAIKVYWLLAVSVIIFTTTAGNIDEDYITAGVGLGLVLAVFHFYINIKSINVHEHDA